MSHLSALIEELLGEPLVEWISLNKSQGLSYREIALVLTNETGIPVSKSSVHLWLNNPEEGK